MDFMHISGQKKAIWNTYFSINWFGHGILDKKLSYCWETVRRESMPRIAEMDMEMRTWAEVTFKCTSRSSKVAPIES